MIIENRFIPFKGFKAISILWFIFTRDKSSITDKNINHEKIHWEQQKELLIVGFYFLYLLEWFIRLPFGKAYMNISFEKEAYKYAGSKKYLKTRKKYTWIKYIFN